jgi:hypothetical protein
MIVSPLILGILFAGRLSGASASGATHASSADSAASGNQ